MATWVPATPGFLEALGVPLVQGRGFGDGDDVRGPPVVLISREIARRYFAGRDPIGRRLQIEGEFRTIVGVVGDVSYEGLGKPTHAAVYVPWAQSSFAGAWVAVKTARDARAMAAPIRDAARAVDPLMNPRQLRPLDDLVGETMLRPRFQTWLLSTFGGLALVLAAVGIYGVITYSVAQRTAEIGIRLALGAEPRSVVRLLMGRGMWPVVLGLAAGLAASLALTRVMAGILFVSPTDAPTFAAVVVLLAAVAALATYLPTVRAVRLDALTALRAE